MLSIKESVLEQLHIIEGNTCFEINSVFPEVFIVFFSWKEKGILLVSDTLFNCICGFFVGCFFGFVCFFLNVLILILKIFL